MVKALEIINEADQIDSDAVNELDLFIMNNEELYRRRFMPIISNLKRKIAKDMSSSSGGGAGSFAQLDDVNSTSAKVDGKIIQFDGSSGKFVGSDFVAAASALTGTTLASGITASSLTSVGTLPSLTVDNVSINGATIGHTDDTDLITLSDGAVTIAGNLTVSGTTTTVNQTVFFILFYICLKCLY